MFLWKFQITDFYEYIPCKMSKWKAYQYISNYYSDKTVSFLGKVNNRGNSYVNSRTTYLTTLYKEKESLRKEANYYYYQGWRETPGWGLHYKHLKASSVELYSKYSSYPKILVKYNNWKLKTHSLLKDESIKSN